ncbi:MAG: thioesterase family protein [Hyphomicrobiaceae bacterium]
MPDKPEPTLVYEGKVRSEWIDDSGHMYAAHYVVAFGEASDVVLDLLTVGDAYRRETNAAPFLLELHTTYLREMTADAGFRITLQLLEYDQRRLRYFLRMFDAASGDLVSTVETAIVHVDLATRKSCDWPEAALGKMAEYHAMHGEIEFPPEAGRGISFARR